jgi:hypothetical protein
MAPSNWSACRAPGLQFGDSLASRFNTRKAEMTARRHRMARISYDDQTAAAYKEVRGVPRDGLGAWREAVRRYLGPWPGMTVVDIGAGTGAFAAAFSDWFDLAVLAVSTYPSVEQVCQAFATAGFRRDALEQVPETLISLGGFLSQADDFRRADTNMRGLTEEEFLRGKEQLRRAVQHAGQTARTETRTNWLDLLVLR